MDRSWLKHYPPGIPAEIDPSIYPSLKALLEHALATNAAETAFINMGTRLSYAQLDLLSAAFASWLQQKAGLVPGDRVALMMPNVLQYAVALYGVLRAGMVVVNTNPLYTAHELEHQLKDSGAKVIVILENFAQVLQAVLPRTQIEHVLVTGVGDMLSFPRGFIVNLVLRRVRKQVPPYDLPKALRFKNALGAGLGLTVTPVEVGPEDPAFLQYTGGTTGVSKGAVLTHGNMVANVLQAGAFLITGASSTRGTTIVTALPLYHIFSLTVNALLFAHAGGCNLLITNPRDFPGFVKELSKHRFHYVSGVNTLFNALMHTPGFERIDFSTLRRTLGGGMAVQAAVAQRWKQMTGCILSQGWGLTETSPVVTTNPPDVDFNGSVGVPLPSTDVSIRDDAGVFLGTGEIGEICVKGPQVMRGYWNRPDETAKVMFGDWLRTGDIGYMDEQGFVFICDRKKDMILVSGFNVYPNEVEDVAITHPGILECAAVAQADERSGEVVALFVVKKDPALTAESVIEHCRKDLTGYKVPRHVYFRSELPKTNVGKILRRALRDELRNSGGPLG
ncbi:MAG: AMP-binding protein [Proteobacteria bacterium]|nr:AMP-binding protein [Pseudomonadota bacterium]